MDYTTYWVDNADFIKLMLTLSKQGSGLVVYYAY